MINRVGQQGTIAYRVKRRRGALYVAVLGGSLIVALLSMAAIQTVRMNLNRAASTGDRLQVGYIADAAIEHGLATIANDPDWRTNFTSGDDYPASPVQFGGGSFTWKLIDPDDDLSNDDSDSLLLQGTGILGSSTQSIEVTLQPSEYGLTALEAALHCDTTFGNGFRVDIVTDTFVSSNNNIYAYGLFGGIDGDAEAAGDVAGFISGSETPGVAPRQMPNSNVFDYYLKMGTRIDASNLVHNDHLDLEDVLLSPTSNPWGTPNPEGIYIVDCGGTEIRVRELRVLGTLCLLNLGADSRVEKQVLLEPAISNFPSLLVDGSIEIELDSSKVLKEKINLNPPGSPYLGETNTNTDDEYPAVIRGLVYVAGQLNFVADDKESDFEGVVICNSIAANSDCNFYYDSIFLDSPPPGFGAGSLMEIVPGTWRRIPSP